MKVISIDGLSIQRFSSDTVVWDPSLLDSKENAYQISRWMEHHLFGKKLHLSIIIPVHNREEHLKHCLRALSNQTIDRSEYEIIVVDDGSTDTSGEVGRLSGANVIQTPHRGPGAARNAGIAQAKGEITVFLDADIVVKPDYLESLRKRHSMTNNLLLLGARRHLPEGVIDDQAGNFRLDSREKLLKRYSYCLSHLNHPWSLAYTCNLSVPSYLLESVRFDESFIGWGLEDIDFAYQLYQKGVHIAFSRSLCGYHLYHDRTFTAARYQSWLQNLERLIRKHPAPSIQSFSLFKPVFNPEIQANYFEVFDQFEGRRPNLAAEILDLSQGSEDPLEQIQDWLIQNPGKQVALTDREERILYEVYLPFLGEGRIQSFIPKEEP